MGTMKKTKKAKKSKADKVAVAPSLPLATWENAAPNPAPSAAELADHKAFIEREQALDKLIAEDVEASQGAYHDPEDIQRRMLRIGTEILKQLRR